MHAKRTRRDWIRLWSRVIAVVAGCLGSAALVSAQDVAGALIGTVRDEQGAIVAHAVASVTSPALMGLRSTRTNDRGQLRFPALPPGRYVLEVAHPGFRTYRQEGIGIGVGVTIEISAVLSVAGPDESIVVLEPGSSTEARASGFGTRFEITDLAEIPTRRSSMFDLIRAVPGISPTSPSSGTITTISAFGSGTNENQFLFDGTNFTCPCNGIARAEPGIDFIQEVHVQTVGASAEFGNVQGAVINVVTRQGGDRFVYDTSYYGQPAGLTSRPVVRPVSSAGGGSTGYERVKYHDLTSNLGGPVVRERLWFFAGHQYLRDYDSQPGTDPTQPRTYEQDKTFAKLTWRLSPRLHLMQSVHHEVWLNPERPTVAVPREATTRTHAAVPAMTFGHLTHTLSANTVWDARVGGFKYSQQHPPMTGDRTIPSRVDRGTGLTSGAPPQFGALTLMRTTAKATVSHYRRGPLGADHQWKVGASIERGEHRSPVVVPGGVRYVDNSGPFQAVMRGPSHEGGAFITAAGFLTDAVTFGDRLTINAGVRFDHSRAISQDLRSLDHEGRETQDVIGGLGTLYTWNILSPRLGLTAKLSADGRSMLRASYGSFSQGVLTGELGPFHPGVTPTTTAAFDVSTGGYTRVISIVDPRTNLQLNRRMRAPRTDEYSVSLDREVGRGLAIALAYVHKAGSNFIGWEDVGGLYAAGTALLPDGRTTPVAVLVNASAARRFRLTNPEGYSLSYDGFVVVAKKRRSGGWEAFGSYTLSRAYGLQPSSGTSAGGAQVSTIAPPNFVTFGRDPNDLTNARGRLPNDRPHMLRVMGSVEVPKTGVAVAGNLQYFSGKPWAATAQVALPQGDQRLLLEQRGARRLSSQSLLDVRISRAVGWGRVPRIEVLVDLLNVLNDTAEEGVVTDNLASLNFGRPTTFVDPRRAMLGVRLHLGR